MKVYGIWQGGSSYAPSGTEDLEVFASITEAMDVLRSREDHGHWMEQTFSYLHKPKQRVLCPVVEGSYILLYTSTDRDAEPFALLERGSRGGVKRTNL